MQQPILFNDLGTNVTCRLHNFLNTKVNKKIVYIFFVLCNFFKPQNNKNIYKNNLNLSIGSEEDIKIYQSSDLFQLRYQLFKLCMVLADHIYLSNQILELKLLLQVLYEQTKA